MPGGAAGSAHRHLAADAGPLLDYAAIGRPGHFETEVRALLLTGRRQAAALSDEQP